MVGAQISPTTFRACQNGQWDERYTVVKTAQNCRDFAARTRRKTTSFDRMNSCYFNPYNLTGRAQKAAQAEKKDLNSMLYRRQGTTWKQGTRLTVLQNASWTEACLPFSMYNRSKKKEKRSANPSLLPATQNHIKPLAYLQTMWNSDQDMQVAPQNERNGANCWEWLQLMNERPPDPRLASCLME